MRRRERKNLRSGALSVEAAIVLPLAFTFMLGLFDVGRAITTKQLLDHATRAATRMAIVGTTTLTTTDIQNAVKTGMGSLALQGMSIQVYQADPTTGTNIGSWANAGNGQCIAVQATGNFVPIVPTFSLLPNPMPMNAKVMMSCEVN